MVKLKWYKLSQVVQLAKYSVIFVSCLYTRNGQPKHCENTNCQRPIVFYFCFKLGWGSIKKNCFKILVGICEYMWTTCFQSLYLKISLFYVFETWFFLKTSKMVVGSKKFQSYHVSVSVRSFPGALSFSVLLSESWCAGETFGDKMFRKPQF